MVEPTSESSSSPKCTASSLKRNVADTVAPAPSIKLDDENSRFVTSLSPPPADPSSSPPVTNLDPYDSQHVDEKHQRVVAVSIHSAAIHQEGLADDLARLKSVLNEKLASRQCVAENKIVTLQDGVYLSWKKPSSKYNTNNLMQYNWFPTCTFRFCFHRQPWVTAGPGSTFLDAERVNAIGTRQRIAQPPTPRMSTPVSESPVAIVPPQAARPRPLMTLDLVGSIESTSLDKLLRDRAKHLKYDTLGEGIGYGSFGEVFRCQSQFGEVALKLLKGKSDRPQINAAVKEVAVLESCARCPHIVTLLDVAKVGPRLCLVFEVWGNSLARTQKQVANLASAGNLRTIFQQSLKSLSFLHAVDVIHCDVKPDNFLVKVDFGDQTDDSTVDEHGPARLHLKLADFGSSMVADPARRHRITKATLEREMNYITTMNYRAPEIVFGDINFGTGIDLWALGIMMFHLGGVSFTYDEEAKAAPGLVRSWCLQLGPPRGTELAKLQSFPFTGKFHTPIVSSKIAALPLPTQVQAVFGKSGLALVRRLLSWTTEHRGTAVGAEAASLFYPERLDHVKPATGESYVGPETCSFSGVRHHWNCKTGQVAPEIMTHMMRFQHHEAQAIRAEFTGKKPPPYIRITQLENATKYTIAGWLTKSAKNGVLNNIPVTKKLPFIAVRRWRNALVMITNSELLEDFWSWLKESLAALDGNLGESGESLKSEHPNTWFLAVAEAHITHRKTISTALRVAAGEAEKPAKRRKGAPPDNKIEEPLHNDGSASGVHLGLTWAGKRKVRFLQEAVQPTTTKAPGPTIAKDVVLDCYPGHVYVGGVTGARHQVIHDQFDAEEALLDFHPGPCSVTFMLRSCIFSDRSRNMNTTPNPRNVWHCFTSCVRQLIHDPRFRLPTFDEYMRAPLE